MKSVLIFEPAHTGHHLHWLSILIDTFYSAGLRVILATSQNAINSEEYACFISPIKEKLSGEMQINVNAKKPHTAALTYCRALLSLAKSIKTDIIFIPYLDILFYNFGLLKFNPFSLLRTNAKIQGILFRGAYAYNDVPLTVSNFLKGIIAPIIVNFGPFSRILCVDELIYAYLERRVSKSKENRITLCPTPNFISQPVDSISERNSARNNLGLQCDNDAKIVGVFGLLDNRKGVDLLIKAFLKRGPNPKEYLLLAGRQREEIKLLMDTILKKRINGTSQIIEINRFLSQQELCLAISAVDVVAVAYPRHIGSSGILLEAAAANKPILGSKFGWIGYVIEKFGLGYTLNVLDEQAFKKGLSWAFLNPTFSIQGANTLASANTPEKFKAKILEDI